METQRRGQNVILQYALILVVLIGISAVLYLREPSKGPSAAEIEYRNAVIELNRGIGVQAQVLANPSKYSQTDQEVVAEAMHLLEVRVSNAWMAMTEEERNWNQSNPVNGPSESSRFMSVSLQKMSDEQILKRFEELRQKLLASR